MIGAPTGSPCSTSGAHTLMLKKLGDWQHQAKIIHQNNEKNLHFFFLMYVLF